jgi:hypothetical protein
VEFIEHHYFAQGMQAKILFVCLLQKDWSDSPTLLPPLQGCAQIIILFLTSYLKKIINLV